MAGEDTGSLHLPIWQMERDNDFTCKDTVGNTLMENEVLFST